MQAGTVGGAIGRQRAETQTETETEEQRMSEQEHPTGPRIVAGIDGSPSSLSALRWAIRQAALTGATVDAVMAWHYPAAAGGYGWGPAGMDGSFGFGENAEKVVADAISNAVDPVGLGNTIRDDACRQSGSEVVLLGESAANLPAVDLVLGEVD
jgi:Universal stress protein family